MGKKNQAQRTKNNVVPASSGRSAELLQSSSGVQFVGFSTLKEGGFIPLLSGVSDELDVNINEDFRLVWKKMNKKDTTTKIKALDEFKKLCEECEVEALKPVLPFWPRVFCALSTDEEHRVRESAHTAHRAVVRKAGRNIAPYLKQLIGPWFTGQHDTYAPAASAAQAAFQDAFSPNKLNEAIVFCQEEILNYISNNLLNQSPQSLALNQGLSQEAKDARYQRVMVSSLNGYALYLQRLPSEHLRKAEEANSKLVQSAKFWKFNKDPSPTVRAAWFSALVALCERAPWLLAAEAKHVCMAVFTNLDETEPSVVGGVWQAVLLTFTVVQDVWKHASLEKLVLPKLWKVLREGAEGNASLVFPNLLPLLSKIPQDMLPDKAKFYQRFFESLRASLKVRNVQISASECAAVVLAFIECLRYVIVIHCDDQSFCLSLFEEQMIPLMAAALSDPKLHLARPSLFAGVTGLVNHWSKDSPSPSTLHSALADCFWTRVTAVGLALLEDHLTDVGALAANLTALQVFLATLKNPHLHLRKSMKQVKFLSQRKSNEEEKEKEEQEEVSSPSSPPLELVAAFVERRSQLVQGQLTLCLTLMTSCGDKARLALLNHLAYIVDEYHSAALFDQILRSSGSGSTSTWSDTYRLHLAQWLRSDEIPTHVTLKLIFALLQYVDNESDREVVFQDLCAEKCDTVVEWALKWHQQVGLAGQWLRTRAAAAVCQLTVCITRTHHAYSTLHHSLRNLRQHGWLTVDTLGELLKGLRNNLTSPSLPEDVRVCSSDLLQAMLHNTANHGVLARLGSDHIQGLLYELFAASLQGLPHFPRSWHHCIAVLKMEQTTNISNICDTCVDLAIAVIRNKKMTLEESEHLVTVVEQLVQAVSAGSAGIGEESAGWSSAEAMTAVLRRVTTDLSHAARETWALVGLADMLRGPLLDPTFSPVWSPTLRRSCVKDDPLASVPLQQYVTSMLPFVIIVVKLQTARQTTDTGQTEAEPALVDYAQLREALAEDDLWEWTIDVLQLQSICISIEDHFYNSYQYYLLREKITFIITECRLLCQLELTDLVKHLDLSMFAEGSRSLQSNDPLVRLQKQMVLRNLPLLYGIHNVRKAMLPLRSNPIVKYNLFPPDALEEVAAAVGAEGEVGREQLRVINTCHNRLVGRDLGSEYQDTSIATLDRVFEQYVAQQKENRSLAQLPDEELHLLSEVMDFAWHTVTHDSAHLQQSSWDALMVACAATVLSVGTTLSEREWRPQLPPPAQGRGSPPECLSPWPLSLLEDAAIEERTDQQDLLRLPVVRAICSICRVFCAVSSDMKDPDPQDKAAVIRCAEWRDVFLPGTHSALTEAWLRVAEVPCESPAQLLLVETLSSTVAQFTEYPHFVLAGAGDTVSTLSTFCRLLQSAHQSVQLAAHQMIHKLIPKLVELDINLSEEENVALSCQHMEQTLVYTQSIIDVILAGLRFGDLCMVEPFTDSYSYTRCYLLLWWSLLELCTQACSQLRALYTTWLKEEHLPVLMKTLFCLMPEAAVHGEVHSQRIAHFFSKPPLFDREVWTSEKLSHLSCWLLGRALRCLPAAIRQWWNEAEPRVRALVEHVTANYISPDLCAEELRAIQSQEKKFDNMNVHVVSTTKEVHAVYTLEESQMELSIELAHNHPLALVRVRSGQRMVSTAQTRQWLLQITILLTHQNGSIWDALELWKHSLDKRFEGVEECYICFAILHSVSHQLPKLSCRTCRKKFHSHCLLKWFTTSNKSTCPICRNLF